MDIHIFKQKYVFGIYMRTQVPLSQNLCVGEIGMPLLLCNAKRVQKRGTFYYQVELMLSNYYIDDSNSKLQSGF